MVACQDEGEVGAQNEDLLYVHLHIMVWQVSCYTVLVEFCEPLHNNDMSARCYYIFVLMQT